MVVELHFLNNDEEFPVKKNRLIFISFIAGIMMSISACGKKDSDFAARYAKNKMGATVVDGQKTQEAGEQAASQGLEADVIDIQRYWVPNGQAGPRIVMATILVNNQQVSVTTSHVGTAVSEGFVNVGNHRVVFHAMCANDACNPYYAALEVYQNNQIIIQEGIRKFFEVTSPEQADLYQWFTPDKALPFILNSNIADASGMVGYLNQGAATSLSTSTSGIIE